MGTQYLASVHLQRRDSQCFRQVAVVDLRKNWFPFNANYASRDLIATVQGATLNYDFRILERTCDAWHEGIFDFIVVPAERLNRECADMEYRAFLSVVDLAMVEGEVVCCFWSE